jgi:hypothetical protein
MVAKAKDIFEIFDEWREVNPRDPNTNTAVSKAIAETLKEVPKMFLYQNRGLTLIAESVSFDNQK